MSDLKCCPFCGGEATLKRDQKDDFVEWSVGCYNRGCVCSAHTYCYDNKDDAIRDWNTRKPMDNIVENIEKHLEKDSHNEYSSYYRGNYQMISVYDAIDTIKQEINNGN